MAALAIALLTLLGVAGEGLGQGGDTIATGLPGGVAALEGCLETAAETFRLADAALACGWCGWCRQPWSGRGLRA